MHTFRKIKTSLVLILYIGSIAFELLYTNKNTSGIIQYTDGRQITVMSPYPEPVYTGWSSVHWNATGWPSVHWDTTGRPSEYLQGTLEHHWKNLVETALHWNATG